MPILDYKRGATDVENVIPLGSDRFAAVVIPRDITKAEAARLAAVITSLGLEASPDASSDE